MAVAQGRTTRSRRGMRRSHDSLTGPTLTVDGETGQTHRRHHISKEGYYRGRKVLDNKVEHGEDEE